LRQPASIDRLHAMNAAIKAYSDALRTQTRPRGASRHSADAGQLRRARRYERLFQVGTAPHSPWQDDVAERWTAAVPDTRAPHAALGDATAHNRAENARPKLPMGGIYDGNDEAIMLGA
jgi:hypothetical protein